MISTNSQLPFHAETPMDPLHDECSGLAQLEQHNRGGGMAAIALLSVAFSLGMVTGALVVFALVVTFTK